eukprot:155369-Ditylum_brightwellii.AAC.1
MKAGNSKDSKISIGSYMDNSLVFILDTCWGGTTEPFVCMDKETGERKYIGDCPKAFNGFNNKCMGWIDCWDLICAQKHGEYSIKMYGCNGEWNFWFGDSLVDMLWVNSYSTYRGMRASDNRVRRHGQYKFVTKALEEGLQLDFNSLKNKNKSPFELPAKDVSEQEGVAVHMNKEYHLN